MDKTGELKTNYEAMQGLIDQFQHRQTLKVEPQKDKWYLFEKETHDAWVEQYDDEDIAYIREIWESKGWTVTPVSVFREGKTE